MRMNQFLYQSIRPILIVFSLTLVIACSNTTEKTELETGESLPEEKNRVETVVLEQQDFTREIISNGKLAALQRAELYFESSGFIENINVNLNLFDIIKLFTSLLKLRKPQIINPTVRRLIKIMQPLK